MNERARLGKRLAAINKAVIDYLQLIASDLVVDKEAITTILVGSNNARNHHVLILDEHIVIIDCDGRLYKRKYLISDFTNLHSHGFKQLSHLHNGVSRVGVS